MNLVQLLHRLNIFTLAMFCFQLLRLLFVLHLHVLELLIIPFEQQLQALLVVVPHFLGFLMLLSMELTLHTIEFLIQGQGLTVPSQC